MKAGTSKIGLNFRRTGRDWEKPDNHFGNEKEHPDRP
jgi:hypothetical protein